jgi:shikimate kinase
VKLVFIYGPPGVGKLTVGREVARLTGFRLFHNHVSIACVETVFDFGTPSFFKLVGMIRTAVFEEAARAGLAGLVFTFVYAKGSDDAYVEALAAPVERHGGEVCLVRLSCERETLERRVVSDARREQRKVATLEVLNDITSRHDIFSEVPGRESLSIDNTHLTPSETAARIVEHYGLGQTRATF